MSDLFKKHLIPQGNKPMRMPTDSERDQYDHRKRLKRIDAEIAQLKAERRNIFKMLQYGAHAKKDTAYSLYALQLECGKFYVGFTTDVDRRYKKHEKGKGAQWTKKYKPLMILEVREIPLDQHERAGFLEDDMTIEYAMKYGSEHVRGGGYCQILAPNWPDVVVQNERSY